MVDFGQRRRAPRAPAIAAAWLALLLAPVARAERITLDPSRYPRIVNGLTSHAYPTTGALLYSQGGAITPNNASSWCSGTLIGCQTFLVASHCVADLSPTHYLVYLQHAGLLPVASITRHPSYHGATFPLFDAAVIKLGAAVTGIDPTPVNQTDPLPFIPATGTIVGFGQTQGTANDYGIKRAGLVSTANCPAGLPAGATDTDVLCWSFMSPLGAPGQDSDTCNGDSGGPLFLDLGSGPVVAGITSGGTTADCLPLDDSYDANVFTHRAFILGQLGADSTTTCGGIPPVDDSQTTVIGYDGALGAANASAAYTIHVPAGAAALRVTLNGEDNGSFDANLYVKHGPGASSLSFDCKADGTSVFGACTFAAPAAGVWSIAVARAAGTGAYQLTATVFGVAPASCGNGVAELGEQCDGADAASCPGQCDLSCHCPTTCTPDELVDIKAHVDAAKFKVHGSLLSSGGAFDAADPRQGFVLTLTQGVNSVTVSMPANDPGWAGSNPLEGHYKWTGALNGITRVKAINRSATKGSWKINVGGRAVPGAAGIDLSQPAAITLTIDGACTTTTF